MQVSEDGRIAVSQTGGVMTLQIDRPDKKNALTDALYGALSDALDNAGQDPAIRAVVMLGAGDAFCAGNDISDFLTMTSRQGSEGQAEAQVFRFLRLLGSFSKPLLAGVQGRAVGIGTTMLLHCDHVVLAEDAQLSTPFVSLGLVPEAASSLLLPRLVGHARAFAMLAMGAVMGAQEAHEAGLTNAVVPRAELDDAVMQTAQHIAALPPGAVQQTKALMRNREEIARVMDAEIEIFAARLKSAEAREAFTAFLEKRAPDFSSF